MTGISRTELVRGYGRALQDGAAALFVGAGLSRSNGFVDWKGLMKEIANDLQLDVDLDADLVAIAQYSLNKYGSRDKLNQLLITEFNKDAKPTQNHELIGSLPIKAIWTTNYDKLIEHSLEAAHWRVDV
jgi:NAD-dependent SIR2 family protein deacetylase